MYSCLRKIKEFAKLTEKDGASIEEMLEMFYLVNYPVEEEFVLVKLGSVAAVWKVLSERKRRVLHHAVVELCRVYGRTGFLAGVKLGTQMMEVLVLEENAKKRM